MKFTGDTRLRVYNRCNCDIGVALTTGLTTNIRTGSFAVLSVNDILYIESICRKKKFFSSKMLVAVDESGKDLTLEEIGGFTDTYSPKHYNTDEITTNLHKSAAKLKEWLADIDDPAEIHAILEVAKTMDDLSQSKLKLLQAKIPGRDLLKEDE